MKLRIALISEHASPLAALGGVDCGGQNVYVSQVAQALSAAGHHVDVFTRMDDARQPVITAWKPRLRIIHVPAGPADTVPKECLFDLMPAFTEFVKCFIEAEGLTYDLCHANFWMSGMVGITLKQTMGIPLVITFHALGKIRKIHQGSLDVFPEIRGLIEEEIAQEADVIVAECPQDQDDLLNHYGAAGDKIEVVPCGFNPGEVWPVSKRKARAALGLSQSESIVLQLGRIVPRKGIDNAIRGFANLVRERGVDGRLLIVGGEKDSPHHMSTPEMRRLQKISIATRVSDRVHFMGRCERSRLRLYYSAADVFVTTPWYEPFGITPVEAMACGTAVVGSRVGGIQYTVKDGFTGFLVTPNQPEELAEKLERLLKHPRLNAKFSKEARKRATRYFRWSQVTRRLMEIYEKLAAEHSLPSPASGSVRELCSTESLQSNLQLAAA